MRDNPHCYVCSPFSITSKTVLRKVSSDNLHTLYVNGAEVGSGASFSTAQVYTVGLNPEINNVITINGTNNEGPAGLIATVLVDYSDGTTETFVTDSSWKTSRPLPQLDSRIQAWTTRHGLQRLRRARRVYPPGVRPRFLPRLI